VIIQLPRLGWFLEAELFETKWFHRNEQFGGGLKKALDFGREAALTRPKFRAKLEHNLLRQLLLGVLGISSY
jgi:hypothetical protein